MSTNDGKTPNRKKTDDKAVDKLKSINPAIAQVIKDALAIHLSNKDIPDRSVDEIEAMIMTCQEFMRSFIIIGYDLEGNPVSPLIHANNQQEVDALGAYISKFINGYFNNLNQ